jgi:sugar transferase (PEP-CTERM/EpsH1 system associated)
MRLLLLTHRLPYPPHKGEKIRSLNMLRWLAQRHEVVLASTVDDPQDVDHVWELDPLLKALAYERIDTGGRKVRSALAVLRRGSISVAAFYSPALQRKVDELIEAQQIEAVLCCSSPMAEYVFRSRHRQRLRGLVKVMDLIDVDSYKWRQYAEDTRGLMAFVYRYEARRLAAYEQRIARGFDHLLVVSEEERRLFPGGAPVHLTAIGNGVDLEAFSPRYRSELKLTSPALVFTGVMDYRPNIDGVRWFAHEILPQVRAVVPGTHFYIVGSRPTAEVQALGALPGVVVTGFVKDVRDYVAASSVCVVPLRLARGIQNKLLEALAMGRPVVTTAAAFEGARAVAGRDLLVAGNPMEFATAVIALLQDPAGAALLGRHARRFAEKHCSWAENLEPLDVLLARPNIPTARPLSPVPRAV